MFITKARSIYPISIGVVLGTYFLSIVTTLSDKVKYLKYLTPFKYFDAADIVTSNRIDPLYIIIIVVFIIVVLATTYFSYNRKDIAA